MNSIIAKAAAGFVAALPADQSSGVIASPTDPSEAYAWFGDPASIDALPAGGLRGHAKVEPDRVIF